MPILRKILLEFNLRQKEGLNPVDFVFEATQSERTRPWNMHQISENTEEEVWKFGQITENFSPCADCGRKGRRERVEERLVQHIALGQTTLILGRIGIYKARCSCCKYFRSPISGVSGKARYSDAVREVVANSLIRDRLPYRKVQDRMCEDFCLSISRGYIQQCFEWAHSRISTDEYRQWVVENFSGVMCIDELHDSGRVLLYATDPLNDFTIHFALNGSNDQDHMDAFLNEIKAMGIEAEVIITDGSPLYKDALQEVWRDVEHQLCIFHVIKDVNRLVLDALRSIKNGIKRQGNKGRKKRRGRKKKNQAKVKKVSRKDEASFLWEHQYLIVRKEDSLSEKDNENLEKMIRISPEIAVLRKFVRDFYRLFEKGIDKSLARARRTRMEHNKKYQNNPFLAKALKKINQQKFEKMIVFLGWKDMERTSNHVERNNRSFRMMQKTRYKRRTNHTISMAIELDLYAKMLRHELYKPPLIFPKKQREMPLRRAA
jgi:hypothetical protein